MKKLLLLFYFTFCILHFSLAQNPLVKQWDKRFGGTDWEYLRSFQPISDGGFIVGCFSSSGISGDKTQPTWLFSYDYWIVKIDSLGNKQWDKDFGGTQTDYLYSLQQTTDGGYILGGSSYSGLNGDKTQPNWDTILPSTEDYWIVKTDSLGNKQWDKDFGGTSSDELTSVQQTADGGYILGGSSVSGISGDKTQDTVGLWDYWILKTDSLGNKQWDKDYGGTNNEKLYSLQQTMDGGYILGGYSASGISGDKTDSLRGGAGDIDFWIVKIDSMGNKQWDKDFGGTVFDSPYSLQQTSDGGYILGGISVSGISGDKTQDTIGGTDYWIVKIDSLGNKQWDKDFGGTMNEDEFGNISQTGDGGYLISGASYSPAGGDKTENNLGVEQSWIIKTDSIGNKQWDKTIFTTGHDEEGFGIQTDNGCYVFANMTKAGIGGYKTQANWDTSLFSFDFWIIKFCDTTLTTSTNQLPQLPPSQLTIYPNPATDEFTVNGIAFKTGDEIQVTDALGKIILRNKFKIPTLNFQLSTLNFSNGIYIIKIISGGKTIVEKVVKM